MLGRAFAAYGGGSARRRHALGERARRFFEISGARRRARRGRTSGRAEIAAPVLAEEYRGRNLELWMIDRASRYAETRGFHTASLPATDATNRLGRDLEDRYWHRDGAVYVRRFQDIARHEDD
jgi:hypothetical protein